MRFVTHTRWGRVGERGQSKQYAGDLETCLNEFMKKFKDKTGLPWERRMDNSKSGKYTLIDIHYDDASEDEDENYAATRNHSLNDQENRARPLVKSSRMKPAIGCLLELIFNEKYFHMSLTGLGYDHEKLPLGQLGQSTINKAYDVLQKLANAINEEEEEVATEVSLTQT
jgi:poly [ADP-ribose] polymerase